MNYKVNTLRKLRYVALDFTTGMTDLDLIIRKPDGSVFVFPGGEGVWTEQADGVYEVFYTPDVVGLWQEKITSVSNSDKLINTIIVVTKVIDDISTEVGAVETKVDNLDAKVTTVDGKTDTIIAEQGITQGKVDAVDSKATSIEGKIDVNSGKLDTIDGKVGDLSVEIKPGGYLA